MNASCSLRSSFVATPQVKRPMALPHALLEGLSRAPKEIACKYFYDAEGSALFDAICALPEYYQTRTEVALLRRHAGEIAGLIGPRRKSWNSAPGACARCASCWTRWQSPRGYTPDRYFRRLSARRGAGNWRRIIPPCPSVRWSAISPRPLRAARYCRARRGAPAFFPAAPSAISGPTRPVALLETDAGDAGRRRAADRRRSGQGPANSAQPPITMRRASPLPSTKICWRAPIANLGADFDLDGFAHYAPYNPYAQRIEMYLHQPQTPEREPERPIDLIRRGRSNPYRGQP